MKTKHRVKWITTTNSNLSKDMSEIYSKLSSAIINEEALAETFDKLFTKYSAHPTLIKSYLDFLQLINGKSLLNQFTNADIIELFESAVNLNEFDFELKNDYYYYLLNVDNNKEMAEKLKKIIIKKQLEIAKSLED